MTDGLFRESVRGVSRRDEFADVTVEEQLVDSAVYKLVLEFCI